MPASFRVAPSCTSSRQLDRACGRQPARHLSRLGRARSGSGWVANAPLPRTRVLGAIEGWVDPTEEQGLNPVARQALVARFASLTWAWAPGPKKNSPPGGWLRYLRGACLPFEARGRKRLPLRIPARGKEPRNVRNMRQSSDLPSQQQSSFAISRVFISRRQSGRTASLQPFLHRPKSAPAEPGHRAGFS